MGAIISMKLLPQYEEALARALHSSYGAAARWAATVRPDDATLRRRISEEFGIQGGFGMRGQWVSYWGGANPGIEIRVGADTPVELSGRELLAAVRDVLGMGRPGELF
jgi:hypothetical protein